jgi:hypothetical protein
MQALSGNDHRALPVTGWRGAGIVAATALILVVSGCGGSGESGKSSKPINLSCVKEKAASTSGEVVHIQDNVAATGAREYVVVDWSENRVVVSSWPTDAVAQGAVQQYERIKAALGKLTEHVVVEQHGPTVARWETTPGSEQLKLLAECST